jgi:hypothetical protein
MIEDAWKPKVSFFLLLKNDWSSGIFGIIWLKFSETSLN